LYRKRDNYPKRQYSIEDEFVGLEFLPNFLPANVTGKRYCPTDDLWKWKKTVRNASPHFGAPLACATEGACDVPTTRNTYNGKTFTIPLYIHIICCTATNCNGVTQQRINDQVAQINSDFTGTGFRFTIGNQRFVTNATSCTLSAYSNSNSQWYTQLIGIKNFYSVSPTAYLNVFVTAQASGSAGTLLGIGTFPWDSAALRATGGLWVNANYFRAGDKTASHEIGHNIGLWHTFHGDSEVACSSQCYETVHSDTGDTTASNEVGDFCADTPAQPMNYYCTYPTGSDCKGNRYTLYGNNPVLLNNIMAYTPDSCMQSFTKQQNWRALCWSCRALRSWNPNAVC